MLHEEHYRKEQSQNHLAQQYEGVESFGTQTEAATKDGLQPQRVRHWRDWCEEAAHLLQPLKQDHPLPERL